MKKEEQDKLIEYLAEALDCWKREAISTDEKIHGHELHQQIVALIKKSEVTDEWINGKAFLLQGTANNFVALRQSLTKMLKEINIEISVA